MNMILENKLDILSEVKGTVETILKMAKNQLNVDAEFESFGVDSIIAMELMTKLSKKFSVSIAPAQFMNFKTVRELAHYISENYTDDADNHPNTPVSTPVIQKKIEINDPDVPARVVHPDSSRRRSPTKRPVKSNLAALVTHINEKYSLNLRATHFSSVDEIVDTLVSDYSSELINYYDLSSDASEDHVLSQTTSNPTTKHSDVAIVGISCQFPEAPDYQTFWNNLISEKASIREIPLSRWDWKEYYDGSSNINKSISKWGAFLEGIDLFDCDFFSISRNHAKLMDPQERLLLHEVHRAFEDACINIEKLAGSNTGIFIGYEYAEYEHYIRAIDKNNIFYSSSSPAYYLANRLSFIFNFCGPSESVNINCASSSVAIHKAFYSLATGESDIAIAGGVSLNLFANDYLYATQNGMLSSSGTCAVFDNEANGFTRGEGVGVVILKPLTEAKKDNNKIYGIIKHSHLNNRGSANSISEIKHESITRVIGDCYKKIEVDPATVNYIEVDGYSTKWGDSLEFEGIKNVFRNASKPLKKNCGLGSLKGNIGHLEPASGVASFIKVALSLYNKKFPATISKKVVNEFIDINNPTHPLYIVDSAISFDAIRQTANVPVRAGINSFADSGVNVHILLEEYISDRTTINNNAFSHQLFIFSAKNQASLYAYIQKYIDFLSREDLTATPVDIAYSQQIGRREMGDRLAIVAATSQELREKLSLVKDIGIQDSAGLESQGIYYGNLGDTANNSLSSLITNDMGDIQLERAINSGKWHEVAILWINGIVFSWDKIWEGQAVSPITLPTYPFAGDRFWLEADDDLTNLVNTQAQPIIKMQENYVAPRNETERALCNIWQEVLGIERIGITDNFFDMGGQSFLLLNAMSKMQKIGVEVLITDITQDPTIAGISDKFQQQTQQNYYQYKYTKGDKIYSLPNRQLLFKSTFTNHWNFTGIVNIENANQAILEQVIREMLEAHQGLRHQFYLENGIVFDRIIELDEKPVLDYVDLSHLATQSERSQEIETVANHLQTTLDMERNLFRFALFFCGDAEPARFLWIIHHSLIDGYSNNIFLLELFARYLSAALNIPIEPLQKGTSVLEWANYLHNLVNSEGIKGDIDYWTSLPWEKNGTLMDFPEGMEINRSEKTELHGKLFDVVKYLGDSHNSALLANTWKYPDITVADIIFTAYANVVTRFTKKNVVTFDMVSNGRDKIVRGVDLSTTIGWVIDYIPRLLRVKKGLNPYEQVKSYREQISNIPNAGLTFGGLRYLSEDASIRNSFEAIPRPEININFIPNISNVVDMDLFPGIPFYLLTPASESPGEEHASRHLETIWAAYLQIMLNHDGKYEFKWMARDNVYKPQSVEKIMTAFINEIEKIIDFIAG